VREEWREAAQIHACRMGVLPQMVEEEEEEEPESVDFGPLLDPGECLFATVSTPTVPTEVIAASTTMAQ
jgi:Reverse transcriptase (RNA-dependent DNA polymerase)